MKVLVLLLALLPAFQHADSSRTESLPLQDTPRNEFKLDFQFIARGEVRAGGLPETEDASPVAAFLSGRTRLPVSYSRPHLEIRVVPQFSGVWGSASSISGASFKLYETWVQLRTDSGLFTKIGRQELCYDNERIIGSNDWAMAAASHDVLKLGYEGLGHKVHLLLAYNQNDENTTGGSVYRNGGYPYKTMQTLWYHYDMDLAPLGVSLLFMNNGMQEISGNGTAWQQLSGVYLKYAPEKWKAEASFYYQFGKNEANIPIQAWMASILAEYRPSKSWHLSAGYDYLSGDEYYYLRPTGAIGLAQHKVIKGFNTLYGSHHQFYGAMDFFYMRAYSDGYTPGLQNVFLGLDYSPVPTVNLAVKGHYLATAIKLEDHDRTLGGEVEFTASYSITDDIKLSAGYTFMQGSPTMEALQRTTQNKRLHWGWIQIVVVPKILNFKW